MSRKGEGIAKGNHRVKYLNRVTIRLKENGGRIGFYASEATSAIFDLFELVLVYKILLKKSSFGG